MSKCPSCQETVKFEASLEDVTKIIYKLIIIRCPQCQTAIGVVDGKMTLEVNEIKNQLSKIGS
jgi:hypothetical protein